MASGQARIGVGKRVVGIPSSRWLARRGASDETRQSWLGGWRAAPPPLAISPLAFRAAGATGGAGLEVPLGHALPLDRAMALDGLPSPGGSAPTADESPGGEPTLAMGLAAVDTATAPLPIPARAEVEAGGLGVVPVLPKLAGFAPADPVAGEPAPMPVQDSSLVERVFLAADSLGERLARILPVERNGGHFAALLLIDGASIASRRGRDDLIERLASCKRHEDWLGHGDDGNFALILTQLGLRADWAARRAEQFASRLVRGPAERGARKPRICVGVTLLTPVNPVEADPMEGSLPTKIAAATELARSALARARESAEGDVRFSDPAIDAMLHSLGTMDRDLREAVDAGRFVIQFQPIVDRRGRLDRAEALLRWRHGNGDLIPADRFFDRAEALGLAVPLGYQVLEVVVRQLAFWAHHPDLAGVRIAVNLSASQLADRHLIDALTALLRRFGVQASRLAVELSESVVALASEDAIRRLQALHALGCRLSIDGFGRGWLTWSRVRQLPLRELKLPIASPAGVGQAARLAALAQEIGLDVTATRIETREQWRDATRAQFSGYQGHLIGRPSASTMGLLAQLQGNGGQSGC